MDHPDPKYEKKVLRDIVEQMEDPDLTSQKQITLRRLVHGVGWILLFVAFFLGINGVAHAVVIAFVAGIGGAGIGFGMYLEFAQKQWPITTSYIDMDSIRKRLNELENQ